MPTLVDIAGGPKGDDLKAQIERGEYPGIVKTTLDGFTSATSWKASRSRRATTSSTIPARPHRPSATRTGRCTSAWCRRTRPASHRRDPLFVDPGRQHQARSLRDVHRRVYEDADRRGRRARRTGHGLRLRLEHAADRPDAVAHGTRTYNEFPPLQDPASYTWIRSATGPGNEGRAPTSAVAGIRPGTGRSPAAGQPLEKPA